MEAGAAPDGAMMGRAMRAGLASAFPSLGREGVAAGYGSGLCGVVVEFGCEGGTGFGGEAQELVEEGCEALGEVAGGDGGGGVQGPGRAGGAGEPLGARTGRAGAQWREGWVGGEDFGFDAVGEGEEFAEDGPEAVAEAHAFDPGAVGGVLDGLDDGDERIDDGIDGSDEPCQEVLLRRHRGVVRHGSIRTIFLVQVKRIYR